MPRSSIVGNGAARVAGRLGGTSAGSRYPTTLRNLATPTLFACGSPALEASPIHDQPSRRHERRLVRVSVGAAIALGALVGWLSRRRRDLLTRTWPEAVRSRSGESGTFGRPDRSCDRS